MKEREYEFNLNLSSDRGRLRGWIDNAPRAVGRPDLGSLGALTDFTRELLYRLLDHVDYVEANR